MFWTWATSSAGAASIAAQTQIKGADQENSVTEI